MPPDLAAAVTLRRPRADEAGPLAELHAWSWRVTYGPLLSPAEAKRLTVDERRQLWDAVIADPARRSATWVAELEARIVGLVLSGRPHDEDAPPDTGEIQAIHVEPGLHGRGIGGRLLSAAETDLADAEFKQATLWVIAENEEARRFYDRQGWAADGATKRAPMGDFAGLPVVSEVRYARRLAATTDPDAARVTAQDQAR